MLRTILKSYIFVVLQHPVETARKNGTFSNVKYFSTFFMLSFLSRQSRQKVNERATFWRRTEVLEQFQRQSPLCANTFHSTYLPTHRRLFAPLWGV